MSLYDTAQHIMQNPGLYVAVGIATSPLWGPALALTYSIRPSATRRGLASICDRHGEAALAQQTPDSHQVLDSVVRAATVNNLPSAFNAIKTQNIANTPIVPR
ncbi:MAG: hypothetical protein OXR66_03610 [Candidatus Woesearchaeota archaeon]|nr:hypothetical protein [Candidatus Woesearchaeota archaeon]